MSGRYPIILSAGALAVFSLTACETTAEKAKVARAEAQKNLQAAQQATTIAKKSKDVRVVDSQVLSDENGAAVVVVVKNKSKKTLANVPIQIDVKNGQGQSVYTNSTPGLEPGLITIPLLMPGETFSWVNDQVAATGGLSAGGGGAAPKSVKAVIGDVPPVKAAGTIPEIEVSTPKLENDPVSGIEAAGNVVNRSKVDMRKLVLFAVATKGGKIVAAGRGGFPRLKPVPKPAKYHIFFIGNPRGADVEITAPPTALK